MGDSKILFDYVPDFGDGLVSIYLMLRQFRSPGGLGHDAVSDFVQIEKISIVFSKIPFIGIHFLDGLIGMTTAGDAKGKIGAVMKGGRRNLCGENETMLDIYSGVFLKPEMGFVILYRPIRFEITRKLKEIAIFIQLSLGSFSLFLFFLQFLLAERMAGRLNQTGIDGYAFVEG